MSPANGLLYGLAFLSLGAWVWLLLQWRQRRTLSAFVAQPRTPVPWDALQAVVGFILCYATLPPLVMFALGATTGEKSTRMTVFDLQVACVVKVTIVVVLSGLLWLGTRASWADFGIRKPQFRRDVLCMLQGLLLCWGPIVLVQIPLHSLREASPHQLLELLRGDQGQMAFWLISLQLTVIAPLEEEFVFRVVLQSALMKRLPAWLSIGFVAITFCAAHQLVDWLPLLPLALLLGVVYHTQRSLLCNFLFHGVFNALNLALALFATPPAS